MSTYAYYMSTYVYIPLQSCICSPTCKTKFKYLINHLSNITAEATLTN